MKKYIMIILIVISLGLFAFSAWQVADILHEYSEGKSFYEDMSQYISVPEQTPTEKPNENEAEQTTLPEEPTEPEDTIGWPKVDFDALLKTNNQVVGWIYIPGTEVNLPIVQGQDNDQYLYRLLNGEYNSAGSIFLDAKVKSDFSTRNSPIYGHNMKNGTMFADMLEYKDQSFFDEHPTGMLLTPEKNYIVHIYSGYVTSSWGNAWDTDFSDEEFAAWLQKTRERSKFTSDVIPTVEDEILTFSTCTYESGDARFVVHAVLEAYDKK